MIPGWVCFYFTINTPPLHNTLTTLPSRHCKPVISLAVMELLSSAEVTHKIVTWEQKELKEIIVMKQRDRKRELLYQILGSVSVQFI